MAIDRSIVHGKRTGFGSLSEGGLRMDSFSMKLFRKGNQKFWDPESIDFSREAEDFAGLAAEGRLADETYLTQFTFEEAKHMQAFRLWFDAVGMDGDLHEFVDYSEPYRLIFTEELPKSLYALTTDPSPAAQIRASVTYNHVVEGCLALTGYFAWAKVCKSRDILPGMQQVIKLIGDDERRHMAWGTFTCRRHVAADDRNWAVVDERMQELMEPAVGLIARTFETFDEIPFGIGIDEMTGYALEKLNRRLESIENARGKPLQQIDDDYSPMQLEDTFAAEDKVQLDLALADATS